jgi:hypothetical protein
MVKNIRPLAAQDKGKAELLFNLFPGPFGDHAEFGPEKTVQPGEYILPKKGMQDLGGHGVC